MAKAPDTSDESRWILTKTQEVSKQVANHLNKFEFTQAVKALKDFAWDDFCNTYLELVKTRLHEQDKKIVRTAAYVLKAIILMLHPFAPFATDKINTLVFDEKTSLLFAKWPKVKKAAEAIYTPHAILLLREVRRLRGEKQLDNSQQIEGWLQVTDKELHGHEQAVVSAMMIENVKVSAGTTKDTKKSTALVTPGLTLFVTLPETKTDEQDLKKRYQQRIAELQKELERSDKILANKAFIANADPKKVQEERTKRENYAKELESTKRLLK